MWFRKIFTDLLFRHEKKADRPEQDAESPPPTEPKSPYANLGTDSEHTRSERRDLKSKDIFLFDAVIPKRVGTVGLFYPKQGILLIRDPNQGKAGRLIRLESGGDLLPLFGDWDGDGTDTPAFYDRVDANFHIWTSENEKAPQIEFYYGVENSDRVPLVGDWNGDGKDGIGIYAPDFSCFLLRNELSYGQPDQTIVFGPPGGGCIPLAGDWDGDGKDGIGLYNPKTGEFLLRNELSAGEHEVQYRIDDPVPGLIPLVGDWDGDGVDSVGCYDPETRTFYLYNQLFGSGTDISFQFGAPDAPGRPFAVGWLPEDLGREN